MKPTVSRLCLVSLKFHNATPCLTRYYKTNTSGFTFIKKTCRYKRVRSWRPEEVLDYIKEPVPYLWLCNWHKYKMVQQKALIPGFSEWSIWAMVIKCLFINSWRGNNDKITLEQRREQRDICWKKKKSQMRDTCRSSSAIKKDGAFAFGCM